jgi:hypothetical protein
MRFAEEANGIDTRSEVLRIGLRIVVTTGRKLPSESRSNVRNEFKRLNGLSALRRARLPISPRRRA